MKFRDSICLSTISKRIISSISIPCFFPLRRQAIISLSLVTNRSPSRNSCCVAWPTKKNVCELRPGKNFCMTFLITWIYPTPIFWKFSRISIHANELSGDRWEEINFTCISITSSPWPSITGFPLCWWHFRLNCHIWHYPAKFVYLCEGLKSEI